MKYKKEYLKWQLEHTDNELDKNLIKSIIEDLEELELLRHKQDLIKNWKEKWTIYSELGVDKIDMASFFEDWDNFILKKYGVKL